MVIIKKRYKVIKFRVTRLIFTAGLYNIFFKIIHSPPL